MVRCGAGDIGTFCFSNTTTWKVSSVKAHPRKHNEPIVSDHIARKIKTRDHRATGKDIAFIRLLHQMGNCRFNESVPMALASELISMKYRKVTFVGLPAVTNHGERVVHEAGNADRSVYGDRKLSRSEAFVQVQVREKRQEI
jgi:hypothetical protein